MNAQGRKWLITINNPIDAGFDHERIIDLVGTMTTVSYFCLVDEVGERGTFHTHVFLYSEAPIRFNTIKKRFPTAHLDKCYGSCQENRAYIAKEGVWEGTDKAKTTVAGSFCEYGELPTEKEETNDSDILKLLNSVEDGDSVRQILKELPKYALQAKNIATLQNEYYAEQFCSVVRDMTVIYILDADGTFDRSFIYSEEESVCRVTNYRAKGMSFDNYKFEKSIVFDNFTGLIPINEMLTYLEGYPLHLPARFQDRIACYTTVYIISEESPLRVYKGYKAERFLKHITRVIVCHNGSLETIDIKELQENERKRKPDWHKC